MRKVILPVFALASVFLWVACDTAEPTAPNDLTPSFEIADATLNDGRFPHFYWLPPMVAPPSSSGTFVANVNPTVIICMGWVGLPACSPGGDAVVKKYDRTSGDDGEKVLVDVHGQHYHMNWDTDAVTDGKYRIGVWVGPTQMGYADIFLDKNAKNFAHDGMTVELIGGRTLPIKFRIEGRPCADDPLACGGSWDFAYNTLRDVSTATPFDVNIYLYNLQYGADSRLTADVNWDSSPSWSPDGTQIAFGCYRGGWAICKMNANGSGEVVLTTEKVSRTPMPVWSPDGNWIVYQGWGGYAPNGQEIFDLYMVSAGGGPAKQLTGPSFWAPDPNLPENQAPIFYEEWEPRWHPDGDLITFGKSHVDGGPTEFDPGIHLAWNFDIFSLDPFAPDPMATEVNHTQNPFRDQNSPAWSQDGAYLIYSQGDDQDKDLWAMEVAGGTETQLTSGGAGEDQEADISPDGTKILFTRAQEASDGSPILNLYLGDWTAFVASPSLLSYTHVTEGGWGRWR